MHPAAPPPAYPPPVHPSRPPIPGVVLAAAIVTWVGTTLTAVVTTYMTLSFMVIVMPLQDVFEGELVEFTWGVMIAAFIVVVLSLAASLVALFVVYRRRWAPWALIGLSAVTVPVGFMSSYYVWPAFASMAGIGTIVLLLLPDARAWFRPVTE